MITHHPPSDVLFEFATGALTEGFALVVAAHADLCPTCRLIIRRIEAIGGALLDEIEPEPIGDLVLALVVDKLDVDEQGLRSPEAAFDALDKASRALLPRPLWSYVGRSLDRLPWRKVGRVLHTVPLPLAGRGSRVTLVRVRPGAALSHTHGGDEYTLVLAGGYADRGKQFARGDFDVRGPSDLHQPQIDNDGECLCVVAFEGPALTADTVES